MAERILVVDDDLICEFLIAALGSANHLCVKAHDDREALAILASDNEIGMILCSPTVGPDPTRLLECAKAKYPDVPVVIILAIRWICTGPRQQDVQSGSLRSP